jgi:MFS family permease
MGQQLNGVSGRGKWMALTAALLGWMFDGLEMGLFPQVAGPALGQLLKTTDKQQINLWLSVATAGFLIGAATGGVLFGWLGDRLGRVRAMTLSVLTYAVFSGACGLATQAWQIAALRFVAALGMGGEWALGVALVMEIWPGKSRGFLAGVIGSAANLGYLLVAVMGLGLTAILGQLREGLLHIGLPSRWVEELVKNNGWRILLLLGTTPALLTFFIRLFVPESRRWEQERDRGGTSHWNAQDLFAVLIGAAAAGIIIVVWVVKLPFAYQIMISLAALAVVTAGYLFPTARYLQRAQGGKLWSPTLRRMLLAACLSGVPLLATWGSVQFAPTWADSLANPDGQQLNPNAKYYTQFWSAFGACFGTVLGALLGDWIGRRFAYTILCLAAMTATQLFFNFNHQVNAQFLIMVCSVGALSASFYGWLPLYLPELFPTAVRATGQGFGFNFGRVLAAVGVLQMGNLMSLFRTNAPPAPINPEAFPKAASVLCLIYLVGLVIIWFAPETQGKPLPE